RVFLCAMVIVRSYWSIAASCVHGMPVTALICSNKAWRSSNSDGWRVDDVSLGAAGFAVAGAGMVSARRDTMRNRAKHVLIIFLTLPGVGISLTSEFSMIGLAGDLRL